MNTVLPDAAALAAEIAAGYIDLWNETDAARRGQLLARAWTDDASYADPLAQGRGREQISALIGAVQQRFPGFRFSLLGRPDGHGEHLRFSWALGPDGQSDLIKGTDFARLQGGRLQAVTGFLDQVPVGA